MAGGLCPRRLLSRGAIGRGETLSGGECPVTERKCIDSVLLLLCSSTLLCMDWVHPHVGLQWVGCLVLTVDGWVGFGQRKETRGHL